MKNEKWLQVKMPLELWQELAIRAVKRNVSLTDYVKGELERAVSSPKAPQSPLRGVDGGTGQT